MNNTEALKLLDQVTAPLQLSRAQHQQIQNALQSLAVALQPVVKTETVKNPAEPPETK